jgi:alginate O-acetyltransferase complex protein AlgJ
MNDKKTEHTILIAVFLAMLLLPGADSVFHLAPRIKVPENRKLHSRPKLKWTWAHVEQYPHKFEQYFNDHFGLRNALIKGNCFLRAKWLKISTNRNIVFGKEGWLFTKLTYVSLDEKKLIKMQNFLERRVNYFNKQGIKYFLVIVPATESIYPEYLPDAVRLKKPNAYDQFRDHMSRYSKTDALIDVKKSLLENKHFRFPPEWERQQPGVGPICIPNLTSTGTLLGPIWLIGKWQGD